MNYYCTQQPPDHIHVPYGKLTSDERHLLALYGFNFPSIVSRFVIVSRFQSPGIFWQVQIGTKK